VKYSRAAVKSDASKALKINRLNVEPLFFSLDGMLWAAKTKP